ncbi:MAG: hypothetical protein WDW38_007269 [Sanguina aurantia]
MAACHPAAVGVIAEIRALSAIAREATTVIQTLLLCGGGDGFSGAKLVYFYYEQLLSLVQLLSDRLATIEDGWAQEWMAEGALTAHDFHAANTEPGGMRKKDADPKRENGIQQHTRILITLRHLLRDFECSHEETECSVLPNPELLCTTTVELAKRATLSCCIAANMISSDKLDFLEGLSHTLLSYQRMGTPATFTLNDPQLHFEMDDAGSLGNRTTATSNSSCSSIYLTGTTTTISIGNNSRSSNNNSKTSLIPRKSMQDKDLLTLLLNCSLAYPGSLESNLASMLCVVYTWEGPKHTLGFSPQGVACFPLVLRH